jgi:hypothetical protein
MTQAFNLSLFANKLNSSGQTDNTGLQNSSITVTAGTGMSGGGAVALGSSVTLTNAGVTSVTAGTGISVSASTGGVTITNTSVAAGTGFGDIGSYADLAYCGTSNVIAGNTVSGSNLRYASTITVVNTANTYFSEGTNSTVPNTFYNFDNTVRRLNSGNTGYQTPGGTTAMTGTWRAMETCVPRTSEYDGCGPTTTSANGIYTFVRIS